MLVLELTLWSVPESNSSSYFQGGAGKATDASCPGSGEKVVLLHLLRAQVPGGEVGAGCKPRPSRWLSANASAVQHVPQIKENNTHVNFANLAIGVEICPHCVPMQRPGSRLGWIWGKSCCSCAQWKRRSLGDRGISLGRQTEAVGRS